VKRPEKYLWWKEEIGTNVPTSRGDVKAITDCGLYRFLRYNDSIPGASSDLNMFYSGLSGSNVETLADIEQNLYLGDYSTALSTLSGITAANTVESNYVSFYAIYANYLHDLANNYAFSGTDSSALIGLAVLCPEGSGNCIYQARALYEFIFATVPFYPGCDDGTGARAAQPAALAKENNNLAIGLKIYPNPNDGSFMIECPKQYITRIDFYDSRGALVLNKVISVSESILKINVELPDGLYQLVITTANSETYVQRTVIEH
jgi:hypothetical protein